MQIVSFERSIDQLETRLVSVAERCNGAEYELLELIREYEVRQGYRLWMLNSTAEWLNLKCGITLGAAREKVRVALALFDKPLWSKAFREGKLSYSKARAMTRVVDADEQALLEDALSRSATQVENHCRRLRNADRRQSTADANRVHANRWFSCSKDGNGMVHLSADLPEETGMLVIKAIEMAAAALDEPLTEEGEGEGFFAKQADALVDVAKRYLSGDGGEGRRSDNYQVVVHVDESALKGQGGKSDMPVETVERLLCDCSVLEVVEDKEHRPLDFGRKYRTLPTGVLNALKTREGVCQYPGCCHELWLEGHHVELWSRGGRTSVDKTLLLCSKHHRLFHEGGYKLDVDSKGDLFIRTTHRKVLPMDFSVNTQINTSRDACCSFNDQNPSRDGFVEEPVPLYAVSAGSTSI